MADLADLQQINFGGGQGGFYDPDSGTYYDSGGNVLTASDLAQYGAFTVGGGPIVAAPSSAPAGISGAGSGAALSGLSGMFSSIGTAIVNATRPPTLTTASGTLVFNPATGGYTTQTAINASAALNPIILLLLGGVVIWLIVREG